MRGCQEDGYWKCNSTTSRPSHKITWTRRNVHLTFIPDRPLVTSVLLEHTFQDGAPTGQRKLATIQQGKNTLQVKEECKWPNYWYRCSGVHDHIEEGNNTFLQIGGKQVRTKYTGKDQHEKHDNTNVKNAKYNIDNNNTTESLPGDITEDIRLTLTDKLLTHVLQTNTGQRQDWRRDNCRWFYRGTWQEKEEHERL